MIIITGAAGFIGSCLARQFNDKGHEDLILVDDFSREDKRRNLEGKQYIELIHRREFVDWLRAHHHTVECVFHLGARTDTTEKEVAIFDRLNLNYSKSVWDVCTRQGLPLIYASSAATYGLGEHGYKDSHQVVDQLRPLNPYGDSKNEFDRWALQQPETPPYWAGLKFFNVYGPNEYHKGRMASVIYHTVRQIEATGQMKLFRSHRQDIPNGEQSRDFIYVKDVVSICYFFYKKAQNPAENKARSGLYNVGTGTARTFWDLASNTFRALERDPNITFIDTPADIRDTYQYFTEADMSKLHSIGYDEDFYTLEAGIEDYVRNYLKERKIW